jgi:hypothetical protein
MSGRALSRRVISYIGLNQRQENQIEVALADPELVEEDTPLGVGLVVARASGDERECEVVRVGDGGGLVDDHPVCGSPGPLAGYRILLLQPLGRVDLPLE